MRLGGTLTKGPLSEFLDRFYLTPITVPEVTSEAKRRQTPDDTHPFDDFADKGPW